MISVTIRYGATNELTRDFPANTTVGSLLTNAGIQSALGYGANVQAEIDGDIADTTAPLHDGDVVTIATRANAKARAIIRR